MVGVYLGWCWVCSQCCSFPLDLGETIRVNPVSRACSHSLRLSLNLCGLCLGASCNTYSKPLIAIPIAVYQQLRQFLEVSTDKVKNHQVTQHLCSVIVYVLIRLEEVREIREGPEHQRQAIRLASILRFLKYYLLCEHKSRRRQCNISQLPLGIV